MMLLSRLHELLRNHPFMYVRRFSILGVLLGCAALSHAQWMPFSGSNYRESWGKGEYEKALKELEEAIGDRKPGIGSFTPFYDRAMLLFEVGRVDDAIEQMDVVASYYPDPAHTVKLAEFYKYRGLLEEYTRELERAQMQADNGIRTLSSENHILGICRMMELRGDNPKQILNTYLKILMDQLPTHTGAYNAAGWLAYDKYSYNVAADYFGKVLSMYPEDQNALAGMASIFWQSSDPRLEEMLNRLLALNPRHKKGVALKIEMQLDLGRGKAALEMIDEFLEINPNDLEYLGLKAAAQFLEDDMEGMRATIERGLEFNPHASVVLSAPGRIAARHYRFEEATLFLERAVQVNPEDHFARAELAMNHLRLGDQKIGRELLEAAFEADPYNITSYNMLQVLDTIDRFTTSTQGGLHLEMPEPEAKILRDRMAGMLERMVETYQDKYKVELTTPVTVQMFDDHDDFMVRSVGLPGSAGHLGICFGRLVTMDSPRARPPGATNWRAVLWHEFVHVITLQKTNNRLNRWLSEGISVYEEKTGSPAWGQKLDYRFKPVIDEEGWPEIADMQKFFTQPKTGTHLMLGYYLAGEFVHFYVGKHGMDALVFALDLIAWGMGTEEAMVEASGGTERELNQAYHAYLDEQCAMLGNLPDPPKVDESMERIATETQMWMQLPSPFTNALKAGNEAAAEERWADAETAFTKAHELFPDYSAENAPLRELARIQEMQEKREELKETLRQIIEWDSASYAEGRQLAQLLREDGATTEALEAAWYAFDINPFDLENLSDLFAAQRAAEQKPEAIGTIQKLIYADKANRVDHRFDLAQLLAEAGDRDSAMWETVTLLETMPHYWEAQKLLLTLVEEEEEETP